MLVTVEFRVPPQNVEPFIAAANRLQRLRRRNGAYQWQLFRDPSAPDRFVETYMVDSWADHLRQHDRVTVEERDAESSLGALVVAGTEPVVKHMIAVQPGAASQT